MTKKSAPRSIASFGVRVLFWSSFFIKDLGILVIFSQICLVFFNLIIYVVSLRENERDFMNSQANKKNSILI